MIFRGRHHGRNMNITEKEPLEPLPEVFKMAEEPTYGKCVQIRLEKINSEFFLKERVDPKQEILRIQIEEALEEALKDLDRYESFYLLIPRKEWVYEGKEISINIAMDFTKTLGGSTSNWVEILLGWAMQITNGAGTDEAWEAICNKPDPIKYGKLVIWKDGIARRVGASASQPKRATSELCIEKFDFNRKFNDIVPCVTLK